MQAIVLGFIWLGFFATVILGWYFYLKARNKERMALIERDKDISDIYAKRKIKFHFPWLKVGIIFTGFSLGWLAGFILAANFHPLLKGYTDAPFILGIVFLFTAISILIAYFVDKSKTKE